MIDWSPSEIETVQRISMEMQSLLAGHAAEIQQSALIHVLALLLARYRPAVREDVLAECVTLVRKMIPAIEKHVFPGGIPPQWNER
jgi:hypothetical protein